MANESTDILVTGSAGFLGAPLTYNLLEMGLKIIGIDNYYNSSSKNTKKLKSKFKDQYKFYEIDIASSPVKVNEVFKVHKPKLVIHLAALKSVHESMINKSLYEMNNIRSTTNILDSMKINNCKKIIYSSSAAVYGNQIKQPITEEASLKPSSVYAETKLVCEQLIETACKKDMLDGLSLRYFNPLGFHSSGLFREELNDNTGSIIQEIIKVALKKKDVLNIFGGNYQTNDGTCERDFIHIDDILDAHIQSIKYMKSMKGYDVFNIGTGNPVSILKIISTFNEQNKTSVKYKFTRKKPGDIELSYADVSKIKALMGWDAKKDLNQMVKDSWKAYSSDKT